MPRGASHTAATLKLQPDVVQNASLMISCAFYPESDVNTAPNG